VIFSGGLYAQADAPHGHYRRLAERNLPTVLVNAGIDGLGFPHVSCDDSVAVEQAFGHLLSLGHSRIGLLVGPRDHVPSRRKVERARALAAGAGIQLASDDVAYALYSLEAGQAAATRLLARGITGIICASDPLALGAIRAVRRAGLKVPDDVSVVGYDDSALMNCTEPPLTTVRQPIDAMGRMVIELLIAQIAGTAVPHDEFLFEPELVVRGSSGPAPAASPA
jgi:DNA-binding LacI/PurR family transcriptional regulator